MCGIIGYCGEERAAPKILEGLSLLEYRGYDSVGLALQNETEIEIVKCKGRVEDLKDRLRSRILPPSECAIGHTRWATHGSPVDENAHPHSIGKVTLVHNGILENAMEIKRRLVKDGTVFASRTDTEVAAALIDRCYVKYKEPKRAIFEALSQFKGSYALAILFSDRPNVIYAIRRASPLLLAKGADGFYLASDLTALLPFSKQYCILEENTLAVLSKKELSIVTEEGAPVPPEWQTAQMSAEAVQKGGYPHFMLKEIYEQPEALQRLLSLHVKDGLPFFAEDGIDGDWWNGVKRVHLVACGSAMHACLIGKAMLEAFAGLPAEVFLASEYRYRPPISEEGVPVILVSQSGETADTLAALKGAKKRGARNLAIVNVVESSLAREAEYRIYTHAGPEIAVATTKGYCTQAALLSLLAIDAGWKRGCLDEGDAKEFTDALLRDSVDAVKQILEKRAQFSSLARRLARCAHAFYIGRGLDYALSQEAALKLKEISYIHCEAYAAGELKHGTISLIEEGTPVIVLSTEADLEEKIMSNQSEVESRGADCILIVREDGELPLHLKQQSVTVPSKSVFSTVFGSMTAIQLLAYETAVARGCDVDRPRNLAKSVTVE